MPQLSVTRASLSLEPINRIGLVTVIRVEVEAPASMVKEWYWKRSAVNEEKGPPGCVRGMFHFFDFHHLLFTGGCRTPPAVLSPPATQGEYRQQQRKRFNVPNCKGVEAPRNSLELEECEAAIPEDYYGVPVSIQIAIPPALSKKKKGALLEEEKRKSQAVTPRTRSIVARLMGLEVLEDDESPCLAGNKSISLESFSARNLGADSNASSEKKKNKKQSLHESRREKPRSRSPLLNLNTNASGSLSLPDTPRASSERARDTEPRFSLQLNKENRSYAMQELGCLHEPYHDGASTLRSAKYNKCVYQEGAHDRVDQMKRSIRRREKVSGGKENTIVLRRSKEISEKKFVTKGSALNQVKPAPPTLSSLKSVHTKPRKEVPAKPSLNQLKPRAADAKVVKMEPEKCRKPDYERFTEKIYRQPAQLITVKEEEGISITKNRQKPVAKKQDPEFKYVKAILACADVDRAKSLKWFSVSLPIDPTIFHILEFGFPFNKPDSLEAKNVEEAAARLGPLQHRWNRKLLFHLVEEILGDLLLSEPKRWRHRSDTEQLLSRLWSQIRSFPSAVCQVVGDIDSLVAGDLPVSKLRRLPHHPSVVDEAQEIAAEIERDIFGSLLEETAESLGVIFFSLRVAPRPRVRLSLASGGQPAAGKIFSRHGKQAIRL